MISEYLQYIPNKFFRIMETNSMNMMKNIKFSKNPNY